MQLSLGITRDLSCYSTSKGYGCLDYVVLLRTLEHTHGIKATHPRYCVKCTVDLCFTYAYSRGHVHVDHSCISHLMDMYVIDPVHLMWHLFDP